MELKQTCVKEYKGKEYYVLSEYRIECCEQFKKLLLRNTIDGVLLPEECRNYKKCPYCGEEFKYELEELKGLRKEVEMIMLDECFRYGFLSGCLKTSIKDKIKISMPDILGVDTPISLYIRCPDNETVICKRFQLDSFTTLHELKSIIQRCEVIIYKLYELRQHLK